MKTKHIQEMVRQKHVSFWWKDGSLLVNPYGKELVLFDEQIPWKNASTENSTGGILILMDCAQGCYQQISTGSFVLKVPMIQRGHVRGHTRKRLFIWYNTFR